MKHLLYNRAEILAELHKLHNKMCAHRNTHLSAYLRSGGHPKECLACRYYEGCLDGIAAIIRRFGGRVRR